MADVDFDSELAVRFRRAAVPIKICGIFRKQPELMPPATVGEEADLGDSICPMNNAAHRSAVPRPHVIILNGVGSVGKSSTARALQMITARPFLHVAMDAFIDMLPERMIGHPDGLIFETGQDEGKPSIVIRTGPVIEQAMRGMRHAVAAMAEQGNNLVVDEVMIGKEQEQDYRALLSWCNLRLVGLFAPLDVLEARERTRGDRAIGLARWQYERVHRGMTYDLDLDAAASTPLENAQRIRDAFGL